jgi:hypothetical protein
MMARRTEAPGGGGEQAGDVSAARLGEEDSRGERHSRAGVEGDDELEAEAAQEARDRGARAGRV